MKVKVKFSAIPELVSLFGGRKDIQLIQLDFPGRTLKDLLDHLALKVGPKKQGIFLSDKGEISPHILVLINGRPIRGLNRVGRMLRENDVVELALPLG
jgi:hypothetical protein